MAIFWGDSESKADRLYQKGELESAAQMYLRAKRPQRAAEVYVELGLVDEAVELYKDLKQWTRAAEILRAQGRPKDAISLFERGKDFRVAAQLAFEQGHMPRAARLFEKAKIFHRAADCYLKEGELDRAAYALEQESLKLKEQSLHGKTAALSKEIRDTDVRRAGLLAKLGRNTEAADLFRDLKSFNRAAQLYERTGNFPKAAEAYLEGGQTEAALEVVERTEEADDELRAEIYSRNARHGEAAQIYERLGRFDEAASAWEGMEEWEKAAEMWQAGGDLRQAAELFLRADRPRKAADNFFHASIFSKAAELYETQGDHLRAAESWEEAEQPFRAGTAYFEAGKSTAARRLLESVPVDDENYKLASLRLAPLLFEAGEMAEGQERLAMLSQHKEELPKRESLYCRARIAEAQKRWSEAAELYGGVFSADSSFRDTAERRERVRRKLREQSASSSAVRPAPGGPTRPTAVRQGESVFKTPLEENASTRPFTFDLEDGEDDSQASVTELGSTAEPEAPPTRAGLTGAALRMEVASGGFNFDGKFDPLWGGAEFVIASERVMAKPVLLVVFQADELGERASFLRRMVRQLASLDHPSILKLEDLVVSDDTLILVYEHFSTVTLQDQISKLMFRPPIERLAILVKLCEALVASHRLGITHQWISPRTILLGDQLRPKLTGIGLSDVVEFGEDTSRVYLSPEVLAGDHGGPATDMFGIGLLAVTLLEPGLPTDWRSRANLEGSEVSWPKEVQELLSPNLRGLLLSCLRPNPAQRPSAENLLNKLQARGLIPGQILAGRYEIVGELGAGGMGRVYRAQDQTLGKEVAIKTVLSPSGGRSEDEDRLFREVQISHKISHPNVVRVHDLGRFPGGIFITMELLEGEGLDVVIERVRELPLAQVKRILCEIADALAEAHKHQIIHRDLKPANVMLVEDERVKVLDFGIARQVGVSAGNLTATGEVIGSPLYMAPEQIRGRPLDGTCDLYALGVIAFTMLTGREPFRGESSTEIVVQHLNDPPPDAGALRKGGLPEAWDSLLEQLLAKEPKHRVQSAAELRERLSELPEE